MMQETHLCHHHIPFSSVEDSPGCIPVTPYVLAAHMLTTMHVDASCERLRKLSPRHLLQLGKLTALTFQNATYVDKLLSDILQS